MSENPKGATNRDTETQSVKEGGLPKDGKTAKAGDNRRAGDLDGNRDAAPVKKPS